MADLDYGELRLFPGNYDEYMIAATQARERLLSDNAKKKRKLRSYNLSLAASVLTHQNPNKRLLALVKLIKFN